MEQILRGPTVLPEGASPCEKTAPLPLQDCGSVEGQKPRAKRSFKRTGWVWLASFALAALTTFVLLDTFALERVMATAQAADTSSIVAAQGGQGSPGADGTSGGAVAGDSESSDESASGASNASGDASDVSGSSTASEGKHGKGSHRHGKHGAAASDGSGGSGASGGSGKHGGKSGSSGSTSSATAEAKAASVVAGAAAASTAGTQVGTYSDENMQITVSQLRVYDTDVYVADVQVSSAEYLKTALAQNAFGRNLKDTTSNMAEQAGAVLAINGDYYGFRDEGYVLRNGVLYRDSAASGTDALVVYGDGTMAAASQDSSTAQQLKDAGAWQVLSFGPVLVDGGQIAVGAAEEVGQSMNSNPRTAIGMVSPLHYVIVVSDGRTGGNEGLSLYQLAQVMIDNGATFAYNLDGGGSTTLYFQGEVLNDPSSGNVDGERKVSDIVYFG